MGAPPLRLVSGRPYAASLLIGETGARSPPQSRESGTHRPVANRRQVAQLQIHGAVAAKLVRNPALDRDTRVDRRPPL